MSDPDPYEPDRVDGVPHPRHTAEIFGQSAAEQAFLAAHAGGRMHHAWLLTGPRGVGKATLAWRIARFLIAARDTDTGPASLSLPVDHPVARRVAAHSDPHLFLMRPTRNPETGTERRDITVDTARKLKDFLHLSASDGGRRVVLIDAADQMNVAASNAILKLLEEPPERTIFLLVCHAPARLLPTIRSRCRQLPLALLGGGDIAAALDQAGLAPGIEPAALSQLSEGSVGEAARLLQQDGPEIYARLVALFGQCPDIDRSALLSLATVPQGTAGQARMDALTGLIGLLLARLARSGAGVPPTAEAAKGEAELFERLSPDAAAARAWANLQQSLSARLEHARRVNLDPSTLILDTGLTLNETGRAILRG